MPEVGTQACLRRKVLWTQMPRIFWKIWKYLVCPFVHLLSPLSSIIFTTCWANGELENISGFENHLIGSWQKHDSNKKIKNKMEWNRVRIHLNWISRIVSRNFSFLFKFMLFLTAVAISSHPLGLLGHTAGLHSQIRLCLAVWLSFDPVEQEQKWRYIHLLACPLQNLDSIHHSRWFLKLEVYSKVYFRKLLSKSLEAFAL